MKIRVSSCIVFLSCCIVGQHVTGLVTSVANRNQVRSQETESNWNEETQHGWSSAERIRREAGPEENIADDSLLHDDVPTEDALSNPAEDDGLSVFDNFYGCICNYSTFCPEECESGPRTCVWGNEYVGYKLTKPRYCHERNYEIQKSSKGISSSKRYDESVCPLGTSMRDVQAIELSKREFLTESCGVAKSVEQEMKQRTEGKRQSTRGDWPWHVALRFEDAEHVHCSGTLIDSSLVLTSAHCLDRIHHGELSKNVIAERVRVFVSDYDGTEVVRRADSIYLPPYSLRENMNYANDIVLIQLDEAVNVMPACLPSETFSLDKFDDLECVSVAYDQSNPTGALCEELQKVTVFNTTNSRCNLKDPMNSRLCAGSQEKNSTCSKSSGGGGLFCKTRDENTEKWMLFGITRGGNIRAKDCVSSLGYYERLAFYIQWVGSLSFLLH